MTIPKKRIKRNEGHLFSRTAIGQDGVAERCKGDILLQGYELYAMGLKAGICPAEVRKVVRALRAEGFGLPVAGISFEAWKKSQGDTRWE